MLKSIKFILKLWIISHNVFSALYFQPYQHPVTAADIKMQQVGIKMEEDDFVSDDTMLEQVPHVQPYVIDQRSYPATYVRFSFYISH